MAFKKVYNDATSITITKDEHGVDTPIVKTFQNVSGDVWQEMNGALKIDYSNDTVYYEGNNPMDVLIVIK